MSDGINFVDLPPWQQMNFSRNCTKYGNWLASILLPNPWSPNLSLGGSIPLSVELFLSAQPDNFSYPKNWTDSDIVATISAWYGWNMFYAYNKTVDSYDWNDNFTNRVGYNPMKICPAEYCKAVGYTGNADLTGIGVHISYYVEASLATAYLVAYTVWHIRRHAKAKKRPAEDPLLKTSAELDNEAHGEDGEEKKKTLSFGQRLLDSFRGSLDAFLTAAMLMSIAMLVAAIYTSGFKSTQRLDNKNNLPLQFYGSGVYDMVLSLLAACFSIFPVMLLYALMGRHNGRRWGGRRGGKKGVSGLRGHGGAPDRHRVWMRRCVLCIMWMLIITEVYLSPHGEFDYDDRHDDKVMDEDICSHRGGTSYWAGMKAAQFLVVGVPLLWLFITAFLLTGFRIPGLVEKQWVTRWRSIWRLLIAWINLLFMWGLLAYFTILRKKIIDTADGLDNEDSWSFGQILALATWVPMLAEFMYIFIWGIEESLGTHLPTGYVVTRNDDDLSLFSAATVGLYPFGDAKSEGDNVSLLTRRSQVSFADPMQSTTTLEMAPIETAYKGAAVVKTAATPDTPYSGTGLMVASPSTPGYFSSGDVYAQEQQQRQSPEIYHGGQHNWQAHPAWDQWNSTGW